MLATFARKSDIAECKFWLCVQIDTSSAWNDKTKQIFECIPISQTRIFDFRFITLFLEVGWGVWFIASNTLTMDLFGNILTGCPVKAAKVSYLSAIKMKVSFTVHSSFAICLRCDVIVCFSGTIKFLVTFLVFLWKLHFYLTPFWMFIKSTSELISALKSHMCNFPHCGFIVRKHTF